MEDSATEPYDPFADNAHGALAEDNDDEHGSVDHDHDMQRQLR